MRYTFVKVHNAMLIKIIKICFYIFQLRWLACFMASPACLKSGCSESKIIFTKLKSSQLAAGLPTIFKTSCLSLDSLCCVYASRPVSPKTPPAQKRSKANYLFLTMSKLLMQRPDLLLHINILHHI